MLTSKAHLQLSEATAQTLRMCALAAARTWTAPVLGGLSLWSQVLRVPPLRAAAPPVAGQPPSAGSFASYRSGGGHATAQVIAPDGDQRK
jgi:hypothetical protein